MADGSDAPAITPGKLADVSMRTGATALRSLRALRAAGGDTEVAVHLLMEMQDRRSTRIVQYGSDFTAALGDVPGFARGYRNAHRLLELGRRLRVLREARGLSLADLAHRAGVGSEDLRRFESGKWGRRGDSLRMLEQILAELGYRMEHRIVPAEGTSATDDARITAFALTRLLGKSTLSAD